MLSLLMKNSCQYWAQKLREKNYYYVFSSRKNKFILLKCFTMTTVILQDVILNL